jgi:hypothetical protein
MGFLIEKFRRLVNEKFGADPPVKESVVDNKFPNLGYDSILGGRKILFGNGVRNLKKTPICIKVVRRFLICSEN